MGNGPALSKIQRGHRPVNVIRHLNGTFEEYLNGFEVNFLPVAYEFLDSTSLSVNDLL